MSENAPELAWLRRLLVQHARDTNNEQTAPLLAGGIYEGTYTRVDAYDHFEILYAATTPFTLQKIWSNDGVNALGGLFGASTVASRTINGYNVVYDVNEGRNIAPYYKLKVTNGASDQTAYPGFIGITWLMRSPYQGAFSFLTDPLTNLSKALLVRAAAPQLSDTGNSKVYTSADGTTQFVGALYQTRDSGVVRQLVVLAARDSVGNPNNSTLGGTFVFEYSDNGIDITISESRTIHDFSTVRDFDLLNAGFYFRVKFTPSRALTGSEAVFITVTQRTQNDGAFARLANQQIEEDNAAMPQVFAYLKGFGPDGISTDVPGDGIVYQNSTPLGAGGNLVSSILDVGGYKAVKITVTTDQTSASSGVKVKWYNDAAGTQEIKPITQRTFAATDVSNGGATFILIPRGPYAKLDYTNGGSPQGSFRVIVTLHNAALVNPVGEFGQAVTLSSLALMCLSMLQAVDDSGTPALLTKASSGGLRVAVNQHEVETPLKSLTSFKVTRASVTTTATTVFTPSANCRSWTAKAICSAGKVIYVGESDGVATTGSGFPLQNSEWVGGDLSSGALHASCDSGTQALAIFEVIL